jgi:endonuclease YncB( thermonuclease family)
LQVFWTLKTIISLGVGIGLAIADPVVLTGSPRVIDGDTIELAGERIRLHGIDAPEMKQTCRTRAGKVQHCGRLAKQDLERIVRGQDIKCKGIE